MAHAFELARLPHFTPHSRAANPFQRQSFSQLTHTAAFEYLILFQIVGCRGQGNRCYLAAPSLRAARNVQS
jgi:hypothetical protein